MRRWFQNDKTTYGLYRPIYFRPAESVCLCGADGYGNARRYRRYCLTAGSKIWYDMAFPLYRPAMVRFSSKEYNAHRRNRIYYAPLTAKIGKRLCRIVSKSARHFSCTDLFRTYIVFLPELSKQGLHLHEDEARKGQTLAKLGEDANLFRLPEESAKAFY